MTRHRPLRFALRSLPRTALLFALCALLFAAAYAQSATATLSGTVEDQNGAIVPGAAVTLVNRATGLQRETMTNDQGSFTIPLLQPSTYSLTVRREGFAPAQIQNVLLNVGDQKALQIQLKAGDINATVQVINDAPLINTESAAVSTVVDRNFAENIPLNGRSFQTLIQLTPGVVLTTNNNSVDIGQFSVNGQRASSNYWTVDGVSANVGLGTNSPTSNGLAGSVGSFSALGTTNSLVSVDALQEFRIQTSTFAPEFGRTPGGQISIITRSGTNQFHGSAFDYLRNDALDANDWFANSAGLPKPRERQNDFGGTFSGPLLLPRFGEGGHQPGYNGRNRTFFFFSYEGLRLRLPQTRLTNVPDVIARQSAVTTIQPYLNAYPLANGPDNLSTGVAQFNASFSNPATLDAYSVRVDHKLTSKWSLFGRYNYSPSQADIRGFGINSLSTVYRPQITIQTGTAGATWNVSAAIVNDFRFNYSKTNASNSLHQDNFGGAIPITSLPFPSGFTTQNSLLTLVILSLGSTSGGFYQVGHGATNLQRQINIVDSVSAQKGSHTLKFGVDFRRLSPQVELANYAQTAVFLSVLQAQTGKTLSTTLFSRSNANLRFGNLGAFGQDTWRISPRLTLTYGLRWDVDSAPSSTTGPSLPAVTGFDLSNLSNLVLAPTGTPPFETTHGNVAPRIGVAYELSESQGWQTVLRGGFGVFYDLASSEVGNILAGNSYPFGASGSKPAASFPLTPGTDAPPPIVPPTPGTGQLTALDPNLQLPYAFQWNVAVEQALGRQQTVTASYIGSAGRRLLQTARITKPNPNFTSAQIVTNAAISNYNALQLQFQRRLSKGFQALASYTWSHSIDTASAGSLGSSSNALTALNSSVNRGPSDFDIRQAFSMALTYEVPTRKSNTLANSILQGWSTESILQASSAPPVGVFYSSFSLLSNFTAQVRPNVVSGQALYLSGSQYPGGKGLNPAAFSAPPLGTNNLPTAQGNLQRNLLRGFGAWQWDFAVHRDFSVHESVKLQFRAELFNLLNHPNFGQPVGDLGSPSALNPLFGRSTQMLGQSLSGSVGAGSGSVSPLYQIGGPRSIQFALKFMF